MFVVVSIFGILVGTAMLMNKNPLTILKNSFASSQKFLKPPIEKSNWQPAGCCRELEDMEGDLKYKKEIERYKAEAEELRAEIAKRKSGGSTVDE
jgi:cell division protein FtsB